MNTFFGIFKEYPIDQVYDGLNNKNPFQRVIDQNKVDIIVNGLIEEEKKYGKTCQTGVLHIAQWNNEVLILDGQHRLSAYYKYNKTIRKGFDQLMCQMWTFASYQEMLQKFRDINNNTQIEEYVKENANNPNANNKEKYDKLIKYVESEYKECIKNTDRPQWPNFNPIKFRNMVNQIPELKHANPDNIIDVFEEFNMKQKDKMMKSKDREDKKRLNRTIDEKLPELYINRFLLEFIPQIENK